MSKNEWGCVSRDSTPGQPSKPGKESNTECRAHMYCCSFAPNIRSFFSQIQFFHVEKGAHCSHAYTFLHNYCLYSLYSGCPLDLGTKWKPTFKTMAARSVITPTQVPQVCHLKELTGTKFASLQAYAPLWHSTCGLIRDCEKKFASIARCWR